jgi:lysophospholipase L1-like esterase
VARIIAKDFLILLVLAGLAEGALRASGSGAGEKLFDAEFTGGKPVAVNAQGFRGPEAPASRAPGDVLILSIGDSTTFGTGVGANETWPQQCAAALEAKRQVRVSAVNAGVPAATLKDLAFGIDHSWGTLKPEAVVLAVSNNMVSLAWIHRDNPGQMPVHNGPPPPSMRSRITSAINRKFRSLRLPEFLLLESERAMFWIGLRNHSVDVHQPLGSLLAHGWRQAGLDPATSGEAWRLFERDLASLRDTVRARNARFYVTAFPCRFMLSGDPADNEKFVPLQRLTLQPGRQVEAICRRLEIPYVDSVQALQSARAAGSGSLYCPMDYVHLDSEGHRIVSQAIARKVAMDLFPP